MSIKYHSSSWGLRAAQLLSQNSFSRELMAWKIN